jgi:hypothetical protein
VTRDDEYPSFSIDISRAAIEHTQHPVPALFGTARNRSTR